MKRIASNDLSFQFAPFFVSPPPRRRKGGRGGGPPRCWAYLSSSASRFYGRGSCRGRARAASSPTSRLSRLPPQKMAGPRARLFNHHAPGLEKEEGAEEGGGGSAEVNPARRPPSWPRGLRARFFRAPGGLAASPAVTLGSGAAGMRLRGDKWRIYKAGFAGHPAKGVQKGAGRGSAAFLRGISLFIISISVV